MLTRFSEINSALARRVAHGVGANTFTQLITILIQLVSVPLFLEVWSVETYGYWVLISAAPTYFAMADVGIMGVAINRMTMLSGQGDWQQVRFVFNSCLLFLGIIVATAAFLALGAATILDSSMLPGIRHWQLAAALLVMTALISMSGSLFDAVFRAEGQYARGVYFVSSVRLVEWGGSMIGLAWSGSFLAVAVGALASRTLGMLVAFLYCRATFPRFEWAPQQGSLAEIRKMLGSALAFMAFPLGHAISIQGMTMLVASLMGPAALAAFSALRTISRSVIQLVSTLSHALWPEFSRLYGASDLVALKRVFAHGAKASAAVAVAAGIAMLFLTPWILKIWTHGKITSNFTMTALFVAATVLGGLWHVPRSLLLATNRHVEISVHYLLASFGLIVLAWLANLAMGEAGLIGALSAFEAYMLTVCLLRIRDAFFFKSGTGQSF